MHYDISVHPVPPELAKNALIDKAKYQAMYRASVEQPEQFWTEQAQLFLQWEQPFTRVREFDFHTGHARWFDGGKLNVAVNCIDRHLAARGNQAAFIWKETILRTTKQLPTKRCTRRSAGSPMF